jgi:hypothetical protein
MRTIACVATGPSLTQAQLEVLRARGWPIYCCNDAIRWCPDAALLHGCNYGWWQHRWHEVRDLPCEKWTTNRQAADEFGINWIAEVNRRGLSTDPAVLHHGHSSGYQVLGMAHRAGAARVVLLGYDLRFAPDYDGRARAIGSQPRHFFGEYEPALQHWPSVHVRNGVHVELLDLYQSVAEQGLVEVINCSPGSASTAFPVMDVRDVD